MELDDLRPYHKNPRKITDEDFKLLGESLEKYGDLSGIIYNIRTGQLVGGHQRVNFFRTANATITEKERYLEPTITGTVGEGYIEFKGERFPLRVVDWDEATEEGANIAANKIGGVWDFDKLANEFDMETLMKHGWKEFELGFITADREQGPADQSELPSSMNSYLAGQVKQLTFHFSPEDYEKTVTRLDAAMRDEKLNKHVDVLLFLLDFYEGHRSN